MKKVIFYFAPLVVMAFAFVLVGPVSAGAVATTASTVVCPAGYVCTPVTPQPVGCPTGYICTPVNNGGSSSGGGSSGGGSGSTNSCYNFATNLTIGSTGADVVALQTLLIANGYNIRDISAGSVSKGYFGPSTAIAVSAFQTANGIPSVGFVGPLTRAALNKLSCTNNSTTPSVTEKPKITNVAGKAAGNFEIDAGGTVGITGSYLIGKGGSDVFIGNTVCPITQMSNELIYCTASSNLTIGGTYDLYVKAGSLISNIVQVKVLSKVSTNQPSITVLSPNGGESFGSKDSMTVKWESTGGDRVAIYLAYPDGGVCYVTSVLSSNGSYSFVPFGYVCPQISQKISSGQFKVSLYLHKNGESDDYSDIGVARDSSDAYFTITSPVTSVIDPGLTVLTPMNPKNNTDIFYVGENLPITWSSKYSGVNRIYLLSETGAQVATILATNDNGVFPYTGSSYSWKIPDNIPTGTYKVRVVMGVNIQTTDSGMFKIRNTGVTVQTPTITVVSPNGGEIIKVGETYNITWTSPVSDSSIVSIKLLNDSISCSSEVVGCQNSSGIESSIANKGSYLWNTNNKMFGSSTGPNSVSLTSGSKYKIVVCKVDSSVCDYSNAYFTIIAPTSTPTPTPSSSPTSVVNQSSLNSSIWDAINEYYKSNR